MHGKPLYSLQSRDGQVVIHFHTSRSAWLVTALVMSAIFAGIFLFAVRLGWNGTVLSGIFGGCLSMTAVTWFAAAGHLTRYAIFIEEDLVALRREFYGIPVGSRKLIARVAITDLGVYPLDARGLPNRSQPIGTLCIWANGKSVELEPYFPIQVGVALARDLQSVGVAFPRTYDQLSAEGLMYGRSRYFSF